jgi:hypothetical protein
MVGDCHPLQISIVYNIIRIVFSITLIFTTKIQSHRAFEAKGDIDITAAMALARFRLPKIIF